MKLKTKILALTLGLTVLSPAFAEVYRSEFGEDDLLVSVSGEDWHPEGFEHGMSIPAVYVQHASIVLDGKDGEPAWDAAAEVKVPLKYGETGHALIKALYTDDKIYFRVRWEDSTENRDHYPWVWDAEQQKYVTGQQVEDSVMLSFEAGCYWNPSLLAGYQYDFDGWRWLAARSDPVGQAWDLMGNVADQAHNRLKPTPYPSRIKENVWNVKFDGDDREEISHQSWSELDRDYVFRPVRPTSWYRAEIDSTGVTEIDEKLPAPKGKPAKAGATSPQYKAVKLDGDAGEVGAKGHWEDGYWTVEFSRNLSTPANTATDSVFTRLTQFSVHVFDQTERIDQTSESDRLFLEFLPEEQQVAKD